MSKLLMAVGEKRRPVVNTGAFGVSVEVSAARIHIANFCFVFPLTGFVNLKYRMFRPCRDGAGGCISYRCTL